MILFSFHPRFSIWLLGIHLHLRSLAVTWPSKPAVHPERLHACLRAAPVPSQVSCGDQWIPTMLFNAPYIISLKMPHSPCHSIQEMLTEVQLISFRSSFCELFLFHEKSRFIIPVPQTITRPELAHLTYFFAPLKIQNPPPHPGKKRAHLVRSRFITIFLEEHHGLGVCFRVFNESRDCFDHQTYTGVPKRLSWVRTTCQLDVHRLVWIFQLNIAVSKVSQFLHWFLVL